MIRAVGRALDQQQPIPFQIVVSANGCTDRTRRGRRWPRCHGRRSGNNRESPAHSTQVTKSPSAFPDAISMPTSWCHRVASPPWPQSSRVHHSCLLSYQDADSTLRPTLAGRSLLRGQRNDSFFAMVTGRGSTPYPPQGGRSAAGSWWPPARFSDRQFHQREGRSGGGGCSHRSSIAYATYYDASSSGAAARQRDSPLSQCHRRSCRQSVLADRWPTVTLQVPNSPGSGWHARRGHHRAGRTLARRQPPTGREWGRDESTRAAQPDERSSK